MVFTKKTWLSYGIIGVIVCLVLGLFNLFVYFPIINNIYGDNIPEGALVLPMITGHAFPILSHFIMPNSWLCKSSVPTCISWSAENTPGGVPWTVEGKEGYCTQQTMSPTESCANFSEIANFSLITLILFVIYFGIGAIIGLIIQKKKKN